MAEDAPKSPSIPMASSSSSLTPSSSSPPPAPPPMKVPIEDKVLVVTGGSAGIGAGIAKHFASVGYKKMVLVARRKHKLEEVAAECRAKGADNVLILALDLSDMSNNERVVEATVEEFGRLDILINNVGILPSEYRSPASSMPIEHFNHVMAVNVCGPFVVTQRALPYLEKVRGNVVFVSSIYGTLPVSHCIDYNTSKAAMKMMARIFALEEAPKGVRVNIVSPGHVDTDIVYGIPNVDFKSYSDIRDVLKSLTPIGRIGETSDMARLVEFIVSDNNSFMTGSDICCDGGRLLSQ